MVGIPLRGEREDDVVGVEGGAVVEGDARPERAASRSSAPGSARTRSASVGTTAAVSGLEGVQALGQLGADELRDRVRLVGAVQARGRVGGQPDELASGRPGVIAANRS